jgi:hypothetical protein
MSSPSALAKLSGIIALLIVFDLGPARADALSQEFETALAAAPPWVRDLRCADVATSWGQDLADDRFHQWFAKTMGPVGSGINTGDAYKAFLTECGGDQNWSVVAVVRQTRQLLEGLTPQHAGVK